MCDSLMIDGFPVICYGLPKQHLRIKHCHSCDLYCVSKYPQCVETWRIRGEYDSEMKMCNIKKMQIYEKS